MKKRAHLLLLVTFLWITVLSAQDVAGLTNAFKRGSAQELDSYLGEKVEYVFLGNSKTYDKSSVKQIISDFFAANKVNSFTINHEGNRGESSFIIGTLVTSGGKYRVNCFFKKIENRYLIHQIRIDNSNE